jgi:2-dehydro-3-deoxygalactonokinase
MSTRLLALDWGTSTLRASLLGDGAQALQTRRDARGVMAVPAGGFGAVLRELCGDWLDAHPQLPVIASGMVGSRQGWQEAPYLELPAGPEQAAAALTAVDLGGGRRLHIVPGACDQPRPGRHDVMRGEETQVWGSAPGAGWCVLPGTHSKWVRVDGAGRVCRLHTYMTGELYALLTQHGTPGRLMKHGRRDDAAFAAGLALGAEEHAQATQAFFAARTAGLVGGVAPDALPDYLSGLLIGVEIAGALATLAPDERRAPLLLIGDDELCGRYARALQQLGADSRTARPGSTERGLWRVALAAGLIENEP